MLAAGDDEEEEVPYNGHERLVVLFFYSFHCAPGLVARLSKCESTLCTGDTHVLNLLFLGLNSETYRPDLFARGPSAR